MNLLSYDTILAKDQKRKVAVSECKNNWIAILESKEVNDYKMLLDLSRKLETDVFAVVISDITGAWGFAEFDHGFILNSYFSEEDNNIEGLIENKLNQKGIKIPVCFFREIVSHKIPGWNIMRNQNKNNNYIFINL